MLVTNVLLAIFTGLVAFFTYRLVRATNKYAKTTKDLLGQSREAFDSQKRAFESDTISRIVFSAMQLAPPGTDQQRQFPYAQDFVRGMIDALTKIDRGTCEAIKEGLEAWHDGKSATRFEWLLREVVGDKKE